MRGDQIEGYRVALTAGQVQDLRLAPSMDAKQGSATYDKFVERYNSTKAYELEAMEPADLKRALENAILNVIDLDVYNQELAQEETDSVKVITVRQQVAAFLKTLKI